MSTISTNPLPYNNTPVLPQLKDLLNQLKQDILLSLNCHHIGTIQSFNSSLQTAVATINYQKTYFVLNTTTQQYENSLVSYPTLVDCPVIVLGGGTSSLTFPIQNGDQCLVLFNDRDMDNWYSGSTTGGVATPRLHSFADGIIIVGLRNLNNVLTTYSTSHATLQNGTTQVGVGPSTVKIANVTYTLNGVLQNLITDLQSLITALTANASTFIEVTGSVGSPSPLNPTIVTALTTVATSLSTVSTQLSALLE